MPTRFQHDVFLGHNSADKPRVRRLAGQLLAARTLACPAVASLRRRMLCLSPAALGSDRVGLACRAEALERRRKRSTVLFRDPANAGRRIHPLACANSRANIVSSLTRL